MERPGTYPLYDITCSPLTAGTSTLFPKTEQYNPYRIWGLTGLRNFGRISISGATGQRKLTVQFVSTRGQQLGEWTISETDLKTPDRR
jgi:alkaline phosphatase D